jgi:uncharacterized membrane protein YGL010W
VGHWLVMQGPSVWIVAGLGLFVVGWTFQFLGHYYEGRKPAFMDDLLGLVIGPLFLVAEAVFYFQMRMDIKAAIDAKLDFNNDRSVTYR